MCVCVINYWLSLFTNVEKSSIITWASCISSRSPFRSAAKPCRCSGNMSAQCNQSDETT